MTKVAEPINTEMACTANRAAKYLTFTLANEAYGVSILKIKEIIGMMPITSIPRTPEYVKGVINLRGKVIPVIDLRLRFSMDTIDYNERTCIIVLEIPDRPDPAVIIYSYDINFHISGMKIRSLVKIVK